MKEGDRIELISEMVNDPNPIKVGSLGVISHIGGGVINVKWDDGRILGLIDGVDKYKIYSQGLFFDYFVDEDTTTDNVEIDVIECNGVIYPEEISPKQLTFVKNLFRNGFIELGKVRNLSEESIEMGEGSEYYVMIYEGDDEFLISYDVNVDTDNTHNSQYWDITKYKRVPKNGVTFIV